MIKNDNLFFSCVDSRIQDQGSMYGRFHLGTFLRGQALTFANALRRTLLSEIPGIIMTDVSIQGATHEFSTLAGVEENVLDILLNLKKLVFVPSFSATTELETFKATGFLQTSGPATLTAGDIKLPLTVNCVDPTVHIATLTSGREFSLRFSLEVCRPKQVISVENRFIRQATPGKFFFDTVPMPVQKVNYVIKEANGKQGSEYIVFEVWTDGSVSPQETVQFALRNLTSLFYQFGTLAEK